jgi:hypothetical protein
MHAPKFTDNSFHVHICFFSEKLNFATPEATASTPSLQRKTFAHIFGKLAPQPQPSSPETSILGQAVFVTATTHLSRMNCNAIYYTMVSPSD